MCLFLLLVADQDMAVNKHGLGAHASTAPLGSPLSGCSCQGAPVAHGHASRGQHVGDLALAPGDATSTVQPLLLLLTFRLQAAVSNSFLILICSCWFGLCRSMLFPMMLLQLLLLLLAALGTHGVVVLETMQCPD